MQKSREIGSEFWLDVQGELASLTPMETLVLSGRTAIDIIIQDIQKIRKIRNVYMPAYCCDSMIDPFLRNGIEVNLYDVSFDGQLHYLVEGDKPIDLFYVTNYFGYENTISCQVIEHFKSRGAVILYDKTHSLFMTNDLTVSLADYTFASIRKWMGVVCGAVVNKKKGHFDAALKDYPYLQCKIDAMREKFAFISGDSIVDKQAFLDKYAEFGHHLAQEYKSYSMDSLSVGIWQKSDKVLIRDKRRENAAVLHKNRNLQFLGELTTDSCPLFVPVFFSSNDERNSFRKRLIEKQIYCPVHWPRNRLISPQMKVNHIIDTELSLICDQRYASDDMERIMYFINR